MAPHTLVDATTLTLSAWSGGDPQADTATRAATSHIISPTHVSLALTQMKTVSINVAHRRRSRQRDGLTSKTMSRPSVHRRRATLASLAAELKVSRTTISNAYNRPDQLSADLRERVLETAKRLGYPGPDPVARSLRTRKAGAVGLVLTEPLNYAFSDPAAVSFVAGVAESCEEVGQGLLLLAVGPGRSIGEGSHAVLNAGVDGFVVYSVADDDPYLEVALERNLPVVVVDQPKDVPGTSGVCIDDRAAMRELADYVVGLGHREIGLLTMRLGRERTPGAAAVASPERLRFPHFHVQRERINGVRDAMEAAGVDPDSLTVVECYEHLPTSGGAAAEVALDANPSDHRADVHGGRAGAVGDGLLCGRAASTCRAR